MPAGMGTPEETMNWRNSGGECLALVLVDFLENRTFNFGKINDNCHRQPCIKYLFTNTLSIAHSLVLTNFGDFD
jgi:hypothetical protein